jgi:hypothetical protein
MRKSPAVFAVLALLPLFVACSSRAPDDVMSTAEPITNGVLSNLPIVSISGDYAHNTPMPGLCSGTLLTPNWVLTLDNCGNGKGATACTPQQCVTIDEWHTYNQQADSPTLVHLASPLPFTSVPQLSTVPLANNAPVTCAGVGVGAGNPPREAKFDTTPLPPDRFTLSSWQAGIDWGDYGGGCFWGSTLAGVMSRSGIGIDISSAALWIVKTVNNKALVCGSSTCRQASVDGEIVSCGTCEADQICKYGSCVPSNTPPGLGRGDGDGDGGPARPR